MAPAAAARGESYHAKETPAPLHDGSTGASLLVLLAGVSTAVTGAGASPLGLQCGALPSMTRAASPTYIAGDGEDGALAGKLLAGLIHSGPGAPPTLLAGLIHSGPGAPPALLAELSRRLHSGSGSASIAPATPHKALARPAMMASVAAARGESYQTPALVHDDSTAATLQALLAGVSTSEEEGALRKQGACDGEGGGRVLARLLHSGAPQSLLAPLAELSRRLQFGSNYTAIAPATALAQPARMASAAAARGESYRTPLLHDESTAASLQLLLAGVSAAIAGEEEGSLHRRGAGDGEGGGRVLARLLHSGAPQSLLARLAELSWRLKSGSLVAGTASATMTDLIRSASKMAGVHTVGIQHGCMVVCSFETVTEQAQQHTRVGRVVVEQARGLTKGGTGLNEAGVLGMVCSSEISAKQGQVHTGAGRVAVEQPRAHTWQSKGGIGLSKGGVFGMPLHSLGHHLTIFVVAAARGGGARRGYCSGGGNHDEVTKELACLDERVTVLEKFRANVRGRLFVLGGVLVTTGTIAVVYREEIKDRCGIVIQNFANNVVRDFARSKIDELYNSFKLDTSWPNILENLNYLTGGYLGMTKEQRILAELKKTEDEALAEKKKKEAQDLRNQRKEEEKRRKENYERLERERYELFKKTRPKDERWFVTYQAWRLAESNRFLVMRDDYLHEMFTGRKQWNDEAWIAEKDRLLRYHHTDSTLKRLRENNTKMVEKNTGEEVWPWIGYAAHYIVGGYRWK